MMVKNYNNDHEEYDTVKFNKCPICGKPVTILDGALNIVPSNRYKENYYIQCDCVLEFSIGGCTLKELAVAWNKRQHIEDVIEQLEAASFWMTPTYNDDGWFEDDSEEVIFLDKAIEIVKGIVT